MAAGDMGASRSATGSGGLANAPWIFEEAKGEEIVAGVIGVLGTLPDRDAARVPADDEEDEALRAVVPSLDDDEVLVRKYPFDWKNSTSLGVNLTLPSVARFWS